MSCAWCCGCKREEEVEEQQTEVIVHMNDREANAPYNYPDNFVKTTKYTLWTFLPLELLMQFRRISNFYFLICMVLALIPGVSPVSPATAVAPLVFVVGVAMTKEGVEEFRRHRADSKANSVEVEVLVNGEVVKVPSRQLHVGDVVRVYSGEELHADIFFLSSHSEKGQVFIDTCNLDGETSLKSRKSIEVTRSLCSPETLEAARLTLHTIPPDPGLLLWSGWIDLNGDTCAADLNQFLYRGSVLRKAHWLWGFVIYAGSDTKMFRNLRKRTSKSSDLDLKLNILIAIVFLLQNFFLVLLCSLSVWWNNKHHKHWYIRWYLEQHGAASQWFLNYLTYFVLLSYLIPISLFVTIEVCKVIQVYWMQRDSKMVELVNGCLRRCKSNTSNLNEQLAMVRYIFTDKTGTLTENAMRFKMGDIMGNTIRGEDIEGSLELLNKQSSTRAAAEEYFLALALCHTIQPFPDTHSPFGVVYEGSSPDEVALVTAAAEHGFCLRERTSSSLTVRVEKKTIVYEILATLDFTPERKMMSIVLRERNKERIMLFAKGADSSINFRTMDNADIEEYKRSLSLTLSDMAKYGLRTLLVATRDLTPKEFEEWNARFLDAGKVLVRRSEAVDKVCGEIEQNLRLLGATGIEDKLQEEVPETISFFLDAGVVVWMLTGDKRETAVTVAATASLCDPRNDYVLHVDVDSIDPKHLRAVEKVGSDLHEAELYLERGKEEGVRCTLVIDGISLNVVMEHYYILFLRLSMGLGSAVCCRLTPLQKAEIVRMFQKATGHTAMAIGDGANDVTMLQEARLGIGIIGLEGAQATLAADYVIPRFRNLRRLCAVHGRYSLLRNASCIVVSFYKNFALAFMQFIFSFYCGFSGLTLFDGWLLTFYNIMMTSIPPFFMGIFDKDISPAVLSCRPDLFAPLSRGLYFNLIVMLRWVFESAFHACAIFYVLYPTMMGLDFSRHSDISGSMGGTMSLFMLVSVVLGRLALQVRYWQPLQGVGFVFSAVVVVCFLFAYSSFAHVGESSLYWQVYVLMAGVKFWLYLLLLLGSLIFIIDLSMLYFQKKLRPTPRDVAERERFKLLRERRKKRSTHPV
ncbi:phospholipid-transporting ATPase 1-like protein [Trypanosoma rangeli]|uniref:Phospholipid-transporting ATPase n=1 Tax=Trypanosoma rangeli TaxID=5698 RepID=A0A3R7P4C4_TRYRA|nr:phospholipid-transporting ATPase 1-like protein [Trypanosoma rangeli]RNF12542.1 phospholipid-transporting ATPase 1-like protein [Trypanosoma rangeli]|eukprot:RNF12542.1 phospholipid-transporting ATPase 1-like protein [Trypanosoma rangeli]